jgi:hypothetical protein
MASEVRRVVEYEIVVSLLLLSHEEDVAVVKSTETNPSHECSSRAVVAGDTIENKLHSDVYLRHENVAPLLSSAADENHHSS